MILILVFLADIKDKGKCQKKNDENEWGWKLRSGNTPVDDASFCLHSASAFSHFLHFQLPLQIFLPLCCKKQSPIVVNSFNYFWNTKWVNECFYTSGWYLADAKIENVWVKVDFGLCSCVQGRGRPLGIWWAAACNSHFQLFNIVANHLLARTQSIFLAFVIGVFGIWNGTFGTWDGILDGVFATPAHSCSIW